MQLEPLKTKREGKGSLFAFSVDSKWRICGHESIRCLKSTRPHPHDCAFARNIARSRSRSQAACTGAPRAAGPRGPRTRSRKDVSSHGDSKHAAIDGAAGTAGIAGRATRPNKFI